ncbi:hypothetical protein HPP92_008672 [Vanilla planifolia]|uniref:Protein kinase domain-containing protein n=1 Tax=Vanilla planifolia TaxID=51239 RepID=A0A835V5W4_VANPL|nr:hypothetical protein HPP92_008672 [Vanilla planifolia]
MVQGLHLNKETIMAICISGLLVIILSLCAILVWILWRRKHRDYGSKDIQSSDAASKGHFFTLSYSRLSSLKMLSKRELVATIEYSKLEAATNNFSEDITLGEGSASRVYKACLDMGVLAAVKKLDGSKQEQERMFVNELNFLGRIKHRNIVSLLGCCIHGESSFLVYEYLQNGSLGELLHGTSHGLASVLTWHMRMKIAIDVARGLEYLHETCKPPVILQDLKSSNILLDADYNAKISGFGFAIHGGKQNKSSAQLSDAPGIASLENVIDEKITEKSDVYAFGIILLELLTGRKPFLESTPLQCQSIVAWAMPNLTHRSKLPDILDARIQDTMDPKHLCQVAAVAVLCVQPEPSYRPLISDVLHSLTPLVPIELGGTLSIAPTADKNCSEERNMDS